MNSGTHASVMGNRKNRAVVETVAQIVFTICAFFAVLAVVSITLYMIISGTPAILKVGLGEILFGTEWKSTAAEPKFGILPFILTSIWGTLGAIVIGVPVGLLTAVFLSKVASRRVASVVRPAVELLAGIPSVVYGLIGMMVLVPAVRVAFNLPDGASLFCAIIVLAVMILPTMTTLSVDGLRAVPDSYRQGSLALGYTRWQTIWHVVLKSAMPSLMTAVILGMTRAFGETLAVRMVIGGIEAMPTSLLSPASTITTTLTTSMAVYAEGSAQDDVLWALGLLLMGMSLIFILIIHLIGRKGAKARG